MLKSLSLFLVIGLGGTLLISSLGVPAQSLGAPAADLGTSNCPLLEVDSPVQVTSCGVATT